MATCSISASWNEEPPKKPIEASMNTGSAIIQPPRPTNASAAVATTPTAVNKPSHSLRWPRRSASAPSHGASSMTTRLASELARLRNNVERLRGSSAAQYELRKIGKNATSTVVEKA